ncbi:unnamed protein product [Prunus armeniaca]
MSSSLRHELELGLFLGLPSLVAPTICPSCQSPMELGTGAQGLEPYSLGLVRSARNALIKL